MNTTWKSLTILIAMAISFSSYGSITCHTPRTTKVLVIDDQKVTIGQPLKIQAERSVASVLGVRTKIVGPGFTKVMFHNGAKHIIHIEDKNSFSYVDDYLIIKSAQGHEMTYPLECE
jgi:hypothetical protein